MSLEEEVLARLEKLQRIRELGINPYPARLTGSRNRTIGQLLKWWEENPLLAEGQDMTVAGRIRNKRKHGGLIFSHVDDGSDRIQLGFKKDTLDAPQFDFFEDRFDIADFIEATGTLAKTKTGERTLWVKEFRMLSKALLPLPEKWHGLIDTEIRFRKRYLDLIMNEDVRKRLLTRSKIITAIRKFLDHPDRGFIEVETPTLQSVYGGGFARPFKTHHHALDTDFYLRISDEMYLKRLIIGGMDKVYEITKVFRNEGIDHDHNPEFTMFEAQIAYQDYQYGMNIFEEIFEYAARDALGTTLIKHGDITVDVKRPWTRMKLVDAVREVGGIDVTTWKTCADATTMLAKYVHDARKQDELKKLGTLGEAIAFAFEELVEEKLIQPTIIYDYPIEVSPLAKKCEDPRFTERFEAFALGSEMGNNYSELNDPQDLEKRFMEENKKKERGFDEAHQTDDDYLEAMKHGSPPICGLGIGIDRMIMLLTGADNIKEVILFPTLRPE